MSDEQKIIIIGAGLAGLSAGCYLQMNGYSTEILEMGESAGGLCTSWTRGEYTFDGCLHWLLGTNPESPFHRLWKELGALDDPTIVDHEVFLQVEVRGGKTFSFYRDIDRLEAEMKRVAPEDARMIAEFAAAVRTFIPFAPPIDTAPELLSAFDKLRFFLNNLPLLTALGRWRALPLGEYLGRFNSPFLKEVFRALFDDDRVSALVPVLMCAWMSAKNAGYLIGGSRALVQPIEERYRALGGTIRYRAKVTRITVRERHACGVELDDGTACAASRIISAADGYATIFKMLGGSYVDPKIIARYDTLPLFPALVQVSLGVNDPLAEAPRFLSLPLLRTLIVDNRTRIDRIGVNIYNFDPTLAPEGKTVVTVDIPCGYEYWVNLRHNNPRRYKVEKERIAKEIVGILDNRFEGLAVRVETCDVATPATFLRYTGNWKASYEGWLPTPKALTARIGKTLPGLRDFYLAGQWVEPGGGLPSAALCGRAVAQIICDEDDRAFRTVE